MNRKLVKIVSILALVLVVVSFAMPTFATYDPKKASMDPSQFETYAQEKGDTSGASTSIAKIASGILNIVRIVAVAVAIIMLIVLAIKYISAAPNDKAEIKKHAVVYIVGAIILFSASGILGIIQRFAGLVKPD